jgi:chemotaxis protein MotA
MNRNNIIGVVLGAVILAASRLFGDGAGLMFNMIGILIILSGTLGATFLSYPFDDIKAAFQVARNTYKENPPTAENIVSLLLDVSIHSRLNGLLSLQKVESQMTVTFLRDALGMVVDNYEEEEIRQILSTEMFFFKQRRQNLERIFRHMSGLAPAFGISGSVVGLIGMLAGIGDTDVIMKTIPVALTSTLYGIILSNFLLSPVAESIYSKTRKELLMQKLVIDGVCAIATEQNSHRLKKKLESFLTPASRPSNQKSFEEIKEKYHLLQRKEKTGWKPSSASVAAAS